MNTSEDTDRTDPWLATLADRDAMAEAYRDRDWMVVPVTAGSTGVRSDPPVGLDYVVPGDEADAVADLDPESITDSAVYAAADGARLFLVTELRENGSERVILLAGTVPKSDLVAIAEDARSAGRFRTRLRRADGTVVAEFFHEDPEPFLEPV